MFGSNQVILAQSIRSLSPFVPIVLDTHIKPLMGGLEAAGDFLAVE